MYVAISKELICRVEATIHNMERAELDAATPEFSKEYDIDASELFNLASFGDHVHLLPQLPKEWLRQAKTGVIKIINADGTTYSACIQFQGMNRAYHRPDPSLYGGYAATPELEYNRVVELPDNTPGKAEFIQRAHDARTRFEICTRWGKVHRDVVSFLKMCKSLNEAVKALPTLKLYLSKADIERLERKVERKPVGQESLVANIDVDGLTAAAVAARLAQAA